jgi:hypothetical protein
VGSIRPGLDDLAGFVAVGMTIASAEERHLVEISHPAFIPWRIVMRIASVPSLCARIPRAHAILSNR